MRPMQTSSRLDTPVASLYGVELHQPRAFVAVADDLHVGRAAGRLHVAQPTLSRQIAALERALGVELLSRTRRRLALTAAGRQFLGEARQILDQGSRGKTSYVADRTNPSRSLPFLPAAASRARCRAPSGSSRHCGTGRSTQGCSGRNGRPRPTWRAAICELAC